MKTNLKVLSLNTVRKMADAAEIEARKLGADVGIAVVAADASIFFTRSMDKVTGVLAREVMKRAQNALEDASCDNAEFIFNEEGNLGVLVIDGADEVINKQCAQAALSVIAEA